MIEKQSTINKIKRAETARKGKDKSISNTVFDIDKQDTRKELSQKAKVSERKVKKARKLRKEQPELAEKVLAGDMTLIEAERERQKPVLQFYAPYMGCKTVKLNVYKGFVVSSF